MLTKLVDGRPDGLAAEDLMNLHTTHTGVLELCRHPSIVKVAQALLQTQDVSIFTSRILCKEPGRGKEIPWHQDSNYWPLIPPGAREVRPHVASIWLPFDDVTAENGAMQVLPFSQQPETSYRNCTELMIDSGGSTAGFDNFNLSLDGSEINAAAAKWCYLEKGQSEWHSAWTAHRSDPNASAKRRLVWIVRYCPTGTTVKGGIRGAFDEGYPLIPAVGLGCDPQVPPVRSTEDVYAPCFGNAATLQSLKK